MKNKLISQSFTRSWVLLPKMMLLGLLTTSTIAVADLDEEYFIAHQVAQSHQIPGLLKGDTETLVNEVLAELIKTHKQKEIIKQYYEDKATSPMLKQSMVEAVSSSEFDSWLNEKIATIYMDLYNVAQLRQMYKDSRTQGDADKPSDDMAVYLSQYIQSSLSYEHKKELQEQLFLTKLKEATQNILDQHAKPDNTDKDDDEYY
ncbi:hypothetical protein LP123_02260 [Moraxella bovis]|uniref:Uncharacterized protein n=1 Tax=Moraxella bovis TaxID=476 RepID=A0ABY6M8I2_MORBO|nr:hypothetical protein [Moraxella bovis]AWY21173.1 hypothetical protein DQF64_12200 [Moraxella bovis]OOR87825.1 hypothetical protein B0182_11340 [Moraxella bovis]UYZ81600.1 hypothetical protein LP113_02290 [Moraxella bovis]UYZ89119.1 hypothetical protein LP114_12000 [Moraxella bovis]UYZ95785.1 hypothetical protein LP121_04290 [Moraxella bovis]